MRVQLPAVGLDQPLEGGFVAGAAASSEGRRNGASSEAATAIGTCRPAEGVAGRGDGAELGDGALAGCVRATGLEFGLGTPRSSGAELGDEDVDRPFAALEPAAGADQRRGADRGAVALVDGGGTIRLIVPRSSSSSMKTMPLAVSGRWRATTMPATSTVAPSVDPLPGRVLRRSLGSSSARSSSSGCSPSVIPVER